MDTTREMNFIRLLQEVSDDVTVLAMLQEQYDKDNWGLLSFVARHPDTPVNVLENFFTLLETKKPGWGVTIHIDLAENTNLTDDMFERLTNSEFTAVKDAIIRNPSLPYRFLVKLSRDANYSVVGAVAASYRIKEDLMEELAKRDDWIIQTRLVHNPIISSKVLSKFLMNSNFWFYALKHPSIAIEDLVDSYINFENKEINFSRKPWLKEVEHELFVTRREQFLSWMSLQLKENLSVVKNYPDNWLKQCLGVKENV